MQATKLSVNPQSDQASHAATRALIPSTPLLCALAPSVTTPLYSTTVSQALRQTLRGDIPRKHLPAPPTTRTWWFRVWEVRNKGILTSFSINGEYQSNTF